MYDAWFYRVGESQLGPVPMFELQRLIAGGQIGRAVTVWREGMPGWIPASHVPGLLPTDNGLHFIVPTGQTSKSALAAGYLGLFGIFFFPLGIAGLVLGIIGVRDLRRNPDKNGWARAITGIVLGGLVTLGTLFLIVLIAFGK
jgi:hypothetical protein